MTKEEREHLEFTQKAEKISMEGFNHLVPYMANDYNPRYVEAVKGTPLENMTSANKTKLAAVYKEIYSNRYKDFAKTYKKLFGSGSATPFKNSPRVVFEEYMGDALLAKKLAFREGYAEDWLKSRYASEVQLGGLKNKNG